MKCEIWLSKALQTGGGKQSLRNSIHRKDLSKMNISWYHPHPFPFHKLNHRHDHRPHQNLRMWEKYFWNGIVRGRWILVTRNILLCRAYIPFTYSSMQSFIKIPETLIFHSLFLKIAKWNISWVSWILHLYSCLTRIISRAAPKSSIFYNLLSSLSWPHHIK